MAQQAMTQFLHGAPPYPKTLPVRDQDRNDNISPLGRLDVGSGIGSLSRNRPFVALWGDPFLACDTRNAISRRAGQRLNR